MPKNDEAAFAMNGACDIVATLATLPRSAMSCGPGPKS
jgi:hypothetical protein